MIAALCGFLFAKRCELSWTKSPQRFVLLEDKDLRAIATDGYISWTRVTYAGHRRSSVQDSLAVWAKRLRVQSVVVAHHITVTAS